MTFGVIVVLIITLAALVLFVTEKFPMDFTALAVMVSLMLFGVVNVEEGLSGFSHPATITILALLILSIGLQSTGFVYFISNNLARYTGKSELKILLVIIVVVGLSSAFMNNTAIVAIFLPVIVRCAKIANINPSKVLMPLSFAAMIGGTLTIIGTSTNIIVSSLSIEQGYEPFGLFEFGFLGLILMMAFTIYWLLIGRYLIPERNTNTDLTEQYKMETYLTEVIVKPNSPMIGKPLSDNLFGVGNKVEVIEIIREDGTKFIANKLNNVRAGDHFIIKADIEDLKSILKQQGWEISKQHSNISDENLISKNTILVEAVIGRNSFLIGKPIKNIDFDNTFGAIPIAMRRHGQVLQSTLAETKILFGDTLLMEADKSRLEKFYNSPDFIVLQRIKRSSKFQNKMWLSLIIVAITILIAATHQQINSWFNLGLNLTLIMLTGAVALVFTGCVRMPYIYRKIEWKVFFLLAGLIPLGIAFTNTGADQLFSNFLLNYIGHWSPRAIISVLFAVTILLTSFMSNNATALILTPIAFSIANGLGIDPKPFLVAVMFAASTSFITPVGYQTNMLVFGPGNYRFSDFVKVGGLLTVFFWALATIFIPIFYM